MQCMGCVFQYRQDDDDGGGQGYAPPLRAERGGRAAEASAPSLLIFLHQDFRPTLDGCVLRDQPKGPAGVCPLCGAVTNRAC